MEKPTNQKLIEHNESGYYNGKRYNVGYLYVWASEKFQPEEISVFDLKKQFNELNYDPETLDKIDSGKPILLSHTNQIIDGKHRLFKAIIENKQTISAIKLPSELPTEAEI